MVPGGDSGDSAKFYEFGARACPGHLRGRKNMARRGELHHRAQLTNKEVELMRQLREEDGMSYGQLADKFEVHKSTVQHICTYRTRVSAKGYFDN